MKQRGFNQDVKTPILKLDESSSLKKTSVHWIYCSSTNMISSVWSISPLGDELYLGYLNGLNLSSDTQVSTLF
ncbi:MAG: hypothetical protein CMF51_03065 [Legionellales bacterium]|nr:hypothetical protein [Legionellales bacterium]